MLTLNKTTSGFEASISNPLEFVKLALVDRLHVKEKEHTINLFQIGEVKGVKIEELAKGLKVAFSIPQVYYSLKKTRSEKRIILSNLTFVIGLNSKDTKNPYTIKECRYINIYQLSPVVITEKNLTSPNTKIRELTKTALEIFKNTPLAQYQITGANFIETEEDFKNFLINFFQDLKIIAVAENKGIRVGKNQFSYNIRKALVYLNVFTDPPRKFTPFTTLEITNSKEEATEKLMSFLQLRAPETLVLS